ncbi:sulfite exporter TauE/SafE family protein [Polycladidibacter hongkongensis]|uniref:sulfite exporter TauE/SafE family protein n=1 Tax=Polycladidibacter hongkongensis TaxID=1647556 RepID=UPI0008360875|nr:sulfite exporter TauE/SafE family protein [Pseudovibrio hongkongensis]
MLPITDPTFYLVAIPAVFLVGISKGGLGGGMGLVAVPLMSLIISPVQAAGILLPILVAMDLVGLASYRQSWDHATMRNMLPAAIAGIGVGWLLAAYVSEHQIKLLVGIIAFLFVLNHWLKRKAPRIAKPQNRIKAGIWGFLAGFTSFVSHAGGPPYQMYTLPLRQSSVLFAGTSVIFFTVVNAVKLVPYFFLGQFNAANLSTSLVLLPIAPISTLLGVYLVHRISQKLFYQLTYLGVFVVSLKLVYDGLQGMVGFS